MISDVDPVPCLRCARLGQYQTARYLVRETFHRSRLRRLLHLPARVEYLDVCAWHLRESRRPR